MRISRERMLMDMACVVSKRSTCTRSNVGVVVAVDSRPLVSGYNGAPRGMPHCDHTCNCMREKVMEGGRHVGWLHMDYCPTEIPCKIAVHAEANAVAFAAKNGIVLELSSLYTTMAPCYPCSQLIINAGIVEVVYSRAYRDVSGLHLLEAAGVRVCQQEA